MGRLGCGAVILNMKVPDDKISDIILLLMGDRKTWNHLLPTVTAQRQVRAALKTGAPSWWHTYCQSRIDKASADARSGDDSMSMPDSAWALCPSLRRFHARSRARGLTSPPAPACFHLPQKKQAPPPLG